MTDDHKEFMDRMRNYIMLPGDAARIEAMDARIAELEIFETRERTLQSSLQHYCTLSLQRFDRIAELEAALEDIANQYECGDWRDVIFIMKDIARAALGKDKADE